MFLFEKSHSKRRKTKILLIYLSMFILFSFFFSIEISANDGVELLEETTSLEHSQKGTTASKVMPSDSSTYKIELLEETPIYRKEDANSAKIGTVSPQDVTVVQRDGDYFLIQTWLGDSWIKPKKYINETGLTKLRLEKDYTIYSSNSLDTGTNYTVSPQVVTLIAETDKWWKVETWIGEKYLYKNDNVKVAYLTFDDGPNQNTDNILKILKNYHAKATFFMLEPNMRYNKALVKQMVTEGHFTALHSVSHDASKLYYGSPYNPVWEMEKGRNTLKNITGEDHHLVRVPYGSVPYMKTAFRDALVEYHYKMWDWTIDSNDWRYSASSYWTIVTNVKNQLANVENRGEPVVILMHGRAQTVKALPAVIELLQEKGYQLKAYNPNHHLVVNFWDDERL